MKQVKKQKRIQNTRKKEESLSYTVEVRDKEGQVLQRVSAPSHSYVEQWNQVINVQTSQVTKSIKDIGGANRAQVTTTAIQVNAGIGNINYGIRVGKGTTAVAIDDYVLETPCDEGAGLDEFNHQAVTFTVPAVVGPTCSFTVKRILVNNSGATITGIKEIGCYLAVSFYYLCFRDILPGAVTVPDGGSITVTYTIAATV